MTISTGLQEAPTDDRAAEREERLVNLRPSFVSDAQAPKLMPLRRVSFVKTDLKDIKQAGPATGSALLANATHRIKLGVLGEH